MKSLIKKTILSIIFLIIVLVAYEGYSALKSKVNTGKAKQGLTDTVITKK